MPISKAGNKSGLQGFTLLEILIAMLVFAFIVVIVPPSFSTAYQTLKFKNAVRSVASTLRHVRALAVSRGVVTTFDIALESKHYSVGSSAKNHPLPAFIHLQAGNKLGKNLTPNSAPTFSIIFYPHGGTSGGQIKFSNGGRYYLIVIDEITGRIKVHRANEEEASLNIAS